MSTPIRDTADYFAQKGKLQTNAAAAINSESHIGNQRQVNGDNNGIVGDDDNLMSPVSPESRQPPNGVSRHTRRHQPVSTSSQPFDPRAQWHRVRERLSSMGSDGGSLDILRLHHGSRRPAAAATAAAKRHEVDLSSQSENADDVGKEEAHELHPVRNEDTEDALPSTDDLERTRQPSQGGEAEGQNYFQKPFHPEAEQNEQSKILTEPRPVAWMDTTAADDEGSEQRPERHHARLQWGKTLDKIRLISNLHSLPAHPRQAFDVSNRSLAPYCQPVFEPPFIALSTDERGRRLPPILLPFLSVAVTDSELINYYNINHLVFRIELQYGDIKWVIRRTIADFMSLHYALKLKSRLSANVPEPPSFPSQLKSLIETAKTTIGIHNEEDRDKEKEKEVALNRRIALTNYLHELLQRAHMLVSYDICEFLEISAVSIVQDMGWKGKEGYLENRVRYVTPWFCHLLRRQGWTKEWVILRDSQVYIAFCEDIASTSPTDVFLLDKSFNVTDKTPGLLGRYHHHIILENKFRRITIKGSRRQVDEWMKSIKKVQQESPWVKNHRFGSFAPIRHRAKVKWFVDGEDHFNAVAEAILSAKSEIYIADWWLSPELYLRRPPEKNEDFRIDKLLQRKAREGVMIYIIVYKEMQVALTIDSAHTKRWLQSLHPNIIVQRHPDHRSIDNTVLFWSHHEKMVIVDNRLAFIGGLDLCYGRWDTHEHKLVDHPALGHDYVMFPGQDYSNPRVKDFADVVQHDRTLVDREVTPRMPWHDVTIGVVGPIARDIARHFIQRWNFLKSNKGMHRATVPFLMPKGEYVAARDESKFRGSCRVQLLRSSAQWSSGIEREHSIYNAYMECISKAKHFVYIENQFFISATTQQDKILRNKIAQAMVERIKQAHAKGEKFKIFILIPLIPAFEGDLASSEAYSARNVMHFEYVSISRGGNSIIEKLQEAGINPEDYIGWYSLRNWDCLVPTTKKVNNSQARTSRDYGKQQKTDSGAAFHDEEHQRATADECPGDSSSTGQGSGSPRDSPSSVSGTNGTTIGEAEEREHFVSELIYIHDKLLIVDDRIVLIGSANVNDRSMLGNRDSEVAMLIEDTEMVPSYLDGKEYKAAKFAHSLRMQLWREHLGLLDFEDWSSLMKPDADMKTATAMSTSFSSSRLDQVGSSEELIQAIEANRPDQVLDSDRRSKRTEMEHLALQAAAVLDPLSDHCYYDIWRKTAEANSLIYRELFHCVPDDTVHTFEQHRQFVPDATKTPHGHVMHNTQLSAKEIAARLSQVRGHLVMFPLDYLKDENMLGSSIRETVVPMVIFT